MIRYYLTTLLQFCIPKIFLSVLAGWFADCRCVVLKNALIRQFIRSYRVNMEEALYPTPEAYPTFNDFFIRHLKPTARQMSPAVLISPVDGQISQIGQIEAGQLLQAKGRWYSLSQLLQDEDKASEVFHDAYFATLYLAPKDYHRIHMPIDGRVMRMIYLPGKLFSVQPATTQLIPNLFAQNERVVVFFETPLGEMAMVLVGATIVGKIATSWHGEFTRTKTVCCYDYTAEEIFLKKGEEMGYFKLGSTVILIIAPNGEFKWADKKADDIVRLYEPLV